MTETSIKLAFFVELIIALGAIAQTFLSFKTATKRDGEQEKAIADIQKFLNSTQNFVPRKWYKD